MQSWEENTYSYTKEALPASDGQSMLNFFAFMEPNTASDTSLS